MLNFLLDIVSDDGNPDFVVRGIDYEEVIGFLLILLLVAIAFIFLFAIKYITLKEKYEDLKNEYDNNSAETKE